MSRNRRLALAVSAALCALSGGARGDLVADQTPFSSYRGLWVSRFEYSATNPNAVRTIMANAASIGVTDVMFQVRGQADAYYNSAYEHVVPNYDALGLAISEAHSRGIKLHAWMNMMPLWDGTTLPAGPDYLINQHPEYWVRDAANQPQPLNSGYVIVNPVRTDVKTHLNNVVRDIASKYDIDGIHMDYIRLYQNSTGATNAVEYPSDPYTVALFQQQYPGQTPTGNIASYKSYLSGQITELVRQVRYTLKSARPDAQLTAAVWRDPQIGLDAYQQDWATWTKAGLLDAAMPMIYFKKDSRYDQNVVTAVSLEGSSGIMPGVGIYMQDDAATAYANLMQQYNMAKSQGANGLQLFSYSSLFGADAVAQERLRATRDFFTANKVAPPAVSIANFEAGEGYFATSPTYSGSNRNIASATADRIAGDAHGGSGSQRIIINKTPGAVSFFLRHVSGIGTPGDFGSNLQLNSIGSVGLWLKTTAPDVQVSIAVDDTANGDRGYLQNVIDDGQWHRYEWFLNDVSHWESWLSGDGKIAPFFSIDSVQLTGTQSVTVLMDDVFYDAAAVARNQWTFDGENGLWTTSAHWTGGVPDGVGAVANLLRRATENRTVLLDRAVTVGELIFDNSKSYTVAAAAGAAGALVMDASSGPASIQVVNRGAHTIAVPISLRDDLEIAVDRGSSVAMSGLINNISGRQITKSGAGTLNISGVQRHSDLAALVVEQGTLVMDSDAGNSSNATLDVTVLPGASATFRADQHLRGLHVKGSASLVGGGRLIYTKGLEIDPGGMLDIRNGTLVVQSDGVNRDAILRQVGSWIRSGRGSGGWDGPGLSSSAARTNALAGLVAVVNGEDGKVLDAAFDGDAILVSYTWNGDVDLSGRIDADDYFRIDSGYLARLAQPTYRDGDFNYDGKVDADDYFLIDSAFLGQSGPLAGFAAAVPEPGSVGLITLGMAGILARRRRRD